MIRLLEKELLDYETQAHYAYHKSLRTITGEHNHDFYEVFLITSGSLFHVINGRRELLREGMFVFIRPEDIHYYENNGNDECELLNLAFSQNTMRDLALYLGEGFEADNMMNSVQPLSSFISRHEIEGVKSRFQSLTLISSSNKKKIKTEVRALLVDIIVRYILETPHRLTASPIPEWLEDLSKTMQNKEHFIMGLTRLYELSPKSPEHLSRTLKKYFGRTPTEWINELRVQYSANLLVHTDEPVINVSMESGFENLSHFYHRFKKHFGVSPAQYRKIHRKIVIPR
jgi:AraC family cel operon transcriptional repressor